MKTVGFYAICWHCKDIDSYTSTNLDVGHLIHKFGYCPHCKAQYRNITIDYVKGTKR